MSLVLAFAHTTAIRLAEVAFLLFVIAGIWIATASIVPNETWHLWRRFVVISSSRFRMIVGGLLIAAGGVLLIVAAHWGNLFR
jgi:hypothetical protein